MQIKCPSAFDPIIKVIIKVDEIRFAIDAWSSLKVHFKKELQSRALDPAEV